MNTYHIVVATDCNYLIHTATLMASIADNVDGEINMHVLAFNLTQDDKNLLNKVNGKLSCEFYDLDDEVIAKRLLGKGNLSGDRSLAAFARLLIPEILDESIDRCLYMDVDAVVLNDIAELWNTDMQGYAVAGVLDTNPISRHEAVGLNPEDTYINSGLILWNLDFCRKNNVVDKFAAFIQERNGKVDAMDQGTLNGSISQYIKQLPPPSNVLTTFFQLSEIQIKQLYGLSHTYRDSELKVAIAKPIFVHFTPNLTTRPWQKHCKHPLKKKYWQYRLQVDSRYHLDDDNRPIKVRLLSWMFYHLPWRWYKYIIALRR
jgi:lipopolysaccharide biosynthesis glycosyltransferase